MKDEKSTVIEVDDDFDFDENEVINSVDESVDEPVDAPKQRAKKKTTSTIDSNLREAIVEIVNEETQDIRDEQSRVAKRLSTLSSALKEQAKITTTIKSNNEAVLKAMARLEGKPVSDIIADDSKQDTAPTPVEVNEQKGIIGKTLGAIGSVAHGIIDTAAFVLESTVDLVTFGNARK